MSGDHVRLAKLMRLEIFALVNAVEDVEAGRYTQQERCHLASGLDGLATALRAEDAPLVVDAEWY